MHMRLVAVGDRQPGWVDSAFVDYTGRLPHSWKFSLRALATSRRRKQGDVDGAKREEGQRILKELRAGERVIMLDERGKQLSSVELAQAVNEWQGDGRDVVFVIGGPDGIDADCLGRADFRWSLSKLTLPHGLARIVFAEQLYRASTLNDGHPYHRA